ncbi:restriction endonuclease subunit S [Micromonospora sp. NPDC048986]|uniref:restriction endonuclease subunit S n=1 Tax=Micromonospora sp. NPDC048986 TaxID=3155644 RepID=UPI0033F2D6A0
MTDLPDGWTQVTLGDVALSVKNGIFVSRPGTEPDGVPILRISAVRPGSLQLGDIRYTGMDRGSLAQSDALLTPGDLLFTRYNGNIDYVGACAVVPGIAEDLAYPDKLIRVRVDAEFADPLYIGYAFASPQVRSIVRSLARTTAGQAGISGSSLKSVPIPLPPLAEQRRIVAALDDHLSRLGRGVESLAAVHNKAKALTQSLRHLNVSGQWRSGAAAADGGTTVIVPEREGVKAEGVVEPYWMPGFDIPDHWSWSTLGVLSRDWGYGTSTKCAYGAAGVPVLRIPNVQSGELDLGDMKNAVDESQDLSNYFVSAGDVLFVRTNGSPRLIGRVAVVRQEMQVAFASYLIRFRLKIDTVDPDWVALVVASPIWRHQLEEAAASSAGQYNLNSKLLGHLPIPLPPLNEQRALLSGMSETGTFVDRVARASTAAERKAGALRASLLADAFAGRLVPRVPNDEPASDLISRIHAERAAALPKQKTRSRRSREDLAAPPTRVTGDNYQQEALPL